MSANPLIGFRVEPQALGHVGRDLQRPECILAEADGTLWTADARGGLMRIAADGSQRLLRGETPPPDTPHSLLTGTLPNGLAFAGNGDILIANFGTDRIERMTRDGAAHVVLDSIDGKPLGKVNFVLRDSRDRIWFTVSTMIDPWSEAINARLADGYIGVIDGNGARVVADGLRFANEIRFDATESWLYVAETTGKCVSRMAVRADGSLGPREVFGPACLGDGLVDGICFDAYGNLWATMIFADRLIALTPQGDLLELFNDGRPETTARFEAAFATGDTVPAEVILACGGPTCQMLTSVTFGGPGLREVYLGSLGSTTLPHFTSPVAGLPMVHWHGHGSAPRSG